jgi:hypothetical protein
MSDAASTNIEATLFRIKSGGTLLSLNRRSRLPARSAKAGCAWEIASKPPSRIKSHHSCQAVPVSDTTLRHRAGRASDRLAAGARRRAGARNQPSRSDVTLYDAGLHNHSRNRSRNGVHSRIWRSRDYFLSTPSTRKTAIVPCLKLSSSDAHVPGTRPVTAAVRSSDLRPSPNLRAWFPD